MADEPQNPTAETGTPDAAQNTDKPADKTVPYERFKAVNDKLRAIEQQLTEQKTAAEQAQQKALAEQGEYKKLFEGMSAKLPDLEAKANRVTELEGWLQETLAARLKNVPAHIRPLLEKQAPLDALKWLEENADTLKPQTPGSPSNRGGTVPTDENAAAIAALTPDELRLAKVFGMTPDDYVKYRKLGEVHARAVTDM